jgi:hypothetical protein
VRRRSPDERRRCQCKAPGVACSSSLRRRGVEAKQAVEEEVAVAKKPPPQDQHPPMHPSSVVLDIVGTNRGDRGCSCEEHLDACGTAVLMDDAVVRIQKEQILVEDFKAGKGKM